MKSKKFWGAIISFALMLIVVPVAAVFAGCGTPDDKGEKDIRYVASPELNDGLEGEFIKKADGTWELNLSVISNELGYEKDYMSAEGTWDEKGIQISSAKGTEEIFGVVEGEVDAKTAFADNSLILFKENFIMFVEFVTFIKENVKPDEVIYIGGPHQDYDFSLPKQESNLSLEELKTVVAWDVVKIYGNLINIFEIDIASQVTAISEFDQTKEGFYSVTVTYIPNLDELEKTETINLVVKVGEEDYLHINGSSSGFYLPINSTKAELVEKLAQKDVYVYVDSEGYDSRVSVTEEMITSFDSSKEGDALVEITYKGVSEMIMGCFYDEENIRVRENNISDTTVAKNSTTAPWENNSWYVDLTNGTAILSDDLNGYTLSYEVDGVEKTFEEITATAGIKVFNIVFTKDKEKHEIKKVVFVYDETTKIATNCYFNIPRYDPDVKEDGTIDLSEAKVTVYFNGHYSGEQNLVEGTDYVVISITQEMFTGYLVEEGKTSGGVIRVPIEGLGYPTNLVYYMNK